MRRLIPNPPAVRDESGAVAVIVALLLVALLGIAALVIDIGALHAEKRDLQNGADAAALAVAGDCARGDCGDFNGTASQYSNANAKDLLSDVAGVVIDVAARTVTVTTRTQRAEGDSIVPFGLGRILSDADGATVEARAVVAWGFPGGMATIPLIISECERERFESELVEGDGLQVVYFHGDAEPCNNSESGYDLPGGFGWLSSTDPSEPCTAETTVGTWVPVDTGASVPSECSVEYLASLLGTTVAIPIFDALEGTGSNGQYRIAGFAAFELYGFYFPKTQQGAWLDGVTRVCKGPDFCLYGKFTTTLATSDVLNLDGPDMGVVVVKLTA